MLRLGLFLALVVGCLGSSIHERRVNPRLFKRVHVKRNHQRSGSLHSTLPELPPGVHIGSEGTVQTLRDEILEDQAKLDALKEQTLAAMTDNDQVTVDELKEEVVLIFQDLQYKWDILKQVLGVTLSLEVGLQNIAEKWHLYLPTLNATMMFDSLDIPDLPRPEITPLVVDNPIDPSMIFNGDESSVKSIPDVGSGNSLKSIEEELTNQPKMNLKLLRKALKYWKRIQSGVHTIDDMTGEELAVSKRVACSQVPNTNSAITLLSNLKTASDNGASCSARIKAKANDVKSAISKFHTLAQAIKSVRNGVDGLSAVLIPLSRMPYVDHYNMPIQDTICIGTAASLVKTLLTPMKQTLSNVEPKITRADQKMYPVWKDRMETLKKNAKKAEKNFGKASKKCEALNNYLIAGRDCVCWMNDGSTKTSVINSVEPAVGSAWHGGVLATTASSYISVTSVCNQWDNALNSIINSMGIPGLDSLTNPLSGLLGSLGPMFDLFGEINAALNLQLCMPNPIEATREAGERTWEWTQERGKEMFRGWRRKRSLGRRVFLAKKDSHDFLTNGLIRSTRASDICFSVQQIIDGISSVFSFLLGWAEDILNEILNRLNLSLPGLPNFNMINLDFLDRFNLPNIDLNLNLDFALPFLRLPVPNFPNIPGLSLSLPDFTVDWFNLNWTPPSFNIPQHVCQPLGKK